MKILILSIFSDNKYYNEMLKVHRKYFYNYENVDIYFVQSSYKYNEEIFIEDDMIYVRGAENNFT
jgi:hypothetical protein